MLRCKIGDAVRVWMGRRKIDVDDKNHPDGPADKYNI
jgi:hypothetical protein